MQNISSKHMRRIALFLAILMMLPALVACAGGSEDDGGKKKPGGHISDALIPEEIKYMADLDFGGNEIVIAVSEHTSAEMPLESHQYITGPKRMGADKVMNEIFNRNDVVSDVLNLYPRYIYTNWNYAGILDDIKGKVNTGGKDTPDLYIDQVFGMIRAQMEGYLMNVRNESFTSHLDFGDDMTVNTDGWYNPLMAVFNFGSDEKMYLLASDYFMDVLRMITVTAVNLTDFKSYFAQNGGTDLLYDTVEDGLWTLDKMREWSDVVYRDTGSKPGVTDTEDYLGILTHAQGAAGMCMLPSAGVSLYKVSNDFKTYTVELEERPITAIREWGDALYSKGAYIIPLESGNYGTLATTFTKGSSLFCIAIQLFHLETEELKNMEDNKCVVPYPKISVSDAYRVIPFDNSRVGGILISSKKFEETTAWVQAATLTSQEILDSYYNEALKYKYGTEFGSTIMMDIIYQNISYPRFIVDSAIIAISGVSITDPPTAVRIALTGYGGPTTTYASRYESIARPLREALTIYKTKFDNLK